MKLQSMTDFVLEQSKPFESHGYTQYLSKRNAILIKVEMYANFLKQPLTLGMFVPVDEEGNVLEQPKGCNKPCSPSDWYEGGRCSGCKKEVDAYKEAKENVLLQDFNLIKSDIDTLNETFFIENEKGEQVGHKKSWEDHCSLYGTMIEDLIGFEIELTPSAIKSIGL